MNFRRRDSESTQDWLDPDQEAELVQLLRSAYTPGVLDEERNRLLIEQALDDPLAPPSADELVESERLRRALEGEADHPDAALARALRVAAGNAPAATPEKPDLRRLERAMLDAAPPRVPAQRAARSGRRSAQSRVYVFVGAAAGIAAIAASLLIVLRPAEQRLAEHAAAPAGNAQPASLSVARSTQELFSAKFEAGETSARIDRIAEVRARELRANRYASWGVR